MKNIRTTLRLSMILILSAALIPAFAGPVAAEDCHDPCEPSMTVTGGRVPDAVPNPWGLDPLYAGWTTIDVVLSDHERCDCFIEHWTYEWTTAVDNAPYGQSAGVDVTQVDGDTWLVHNLDADIYEITFTVYVICNGEVYPLTTTYHQFN